MKKYLVIALLLAATVICSPLFAEDAYKYSGIKTADAIIANGPGVFRGLIITPDGTNSCVVALHDSLDNSGAKIVPDFTVAAGESNSAGGLWPFPVSFSTALYADMTSSGCKYEVYGNSGLWQ